MNPYLKTPPAVKNLIIANCLLFLATYLIPQVNAFLGEFGQLFWVGSPHFHLYQFVSYMFLHGSFTHLFFNMFALWMFGRTLEYELGTKRFLTYYFVSGGVERAFDVGHNALLIDHRASGLSDGHVITFGIKERDDCLRWIDFVIKQFGKDVEIILTGISMGAATVLMVSNENLPNNVKYILADCGYTSPKEIIYKVILDMKLPPKLVFPIIKLSARIFGGFNIDMYSAIESVKSTKLPIIFYHGTNDNFVPHYMSETLYNACISHKKLVLVDNAGHGLSYPVEKEKYISALVEFENEIKQKKSDN